MKNNQKKKILVTASTFPRWEEDTEPRFILDYCIGLSKYYIIFPSMPGKHSVIPAPSFPASKKRRAAFFSFLF